MFKKLSGSLIKKFKNKDVLILGIETSCDETSAAVVKNGREVLSNIVSSQIEIHKRFGGVVPEVASREHLMAISNVVNEALAAAKIEISEVDAIAVTYGAGLIGALMVGVSFAKSLAFSHNLPLVAVNHINGHICANYIIDKELQPPFTALIVSGGHSAVQEIKSYTKVKTLITTTDDAIGEAFDKVARVLSLPYPGGPNLEKLAKNGKEIEGFGYKANFKNLKSFSYSGLKTAAINFINNAKQSKKEFNPEDIAYTFQKLAISQVAINAVECAKKSEGKTLVVCGGVSANGALRDLLKNLCVEAGVKLIVPPLNLCTDNAAMIASAGYFNLINNVNIATEELGAKSSLEL